MGSRVGPEVESRARGHAWILGYGFWLGPVLGFGRTVCLMYVRAFDEIRSALQSQSGPFWRPWSWSEINANAPYPCDALSSGDCLREAGYLWPGYYEPATVTRPYSPPANDAVPPYINLTLTKYGDPVDSESFYSICKERDVHQFMAEYPDDVFMKGFDMHLSLPDDIFFRVLAWTSRFQSQDIYETHELSNVTRKVRQDNSDGPKAFVTYTFSTTQRMQRKRSVTKCAGEEWREVWRGYSEEGRPLRTSAESTQQGRHVDHSNLRFRFHPTNFTTKRLLVQSCGWMYQSAQNGYAGTLMSALGACAAACALICAFAPALHAKHGSGAEQLGTCHVVL